MPMITYIEATGARHTVDVALGLNLMEGATLNMVPGVEGMCGGMCSCATCHCYMPQAWLSEHAVMQSSEQAMLAQASHVQANSRLGCQIEVTADMEGLEVHLPPEQG